MRGQRSPLTEDIELRHSEKLLEKQALGNALQYTAATRLRMETFSGFALIPQVEGVVGIEKFESIRMILESFGAKCAVLHPKRQAIICQLF